MALIVSAASGNFNAGATWVGGVAPTVGDEARASNGHAITITANATCDEVSNAGTGIFTLNDGVTLTANVTNKSTTTSRNCVQFTASSPATGTIVGNCTGGTVSTNFAVINSGSGSLIITGNATGGAGASAVAVTNNSTGNVTITGNLIGGSANSAHGANNASTGTLAVVGNATGGSGTNAYGANNGSTGTLTVTGIATGGTTNGAAGVNVSNAGGLAVIGRAKGNEFGIGSAGIVAGVGVQSTQSHVVKVKEIEYGLRGMSPTSGPVYLESDLGNLAILVNYPSGTGSKTLSDPNNTTGLSPAESDVRSGVSYNYGNNTGTCAVPPAGSVALGVPVDATTGTAVLTGSDIANAVWGALLSSHTTNNTFGARVVRSLNSNNTLQLTGSHHAAADVHEFQDAVITAGAFAPSAITLFSDAMRTELTPELNEIGEVHLIHGLQSGSALTVTPSSRTAGAISQTITGDGTTSTTVTRD